MHCKWGPDASHKCSIDDPKNWDAHDGKMTDIKECKCVARDPEDSKAVEWCGNFTSKRFPLYDAAVHKYDHSKHKFPTVKFIDPSVLKIFDCLSDRMEGKCRWAASMGDDSNSVKQCRDDYGNFTRDENDDKQYWNKDFIFDRSFNLTSGPEGPMKQYE